MLESVKETLSNYSSKNDLAISKDFQAKIVNELNAILENYPIFDYNGYTRYQDYYNYELSYLDNIYHYEQTAIEYDALNTFSLYVLIEKLKELGEILFDNVFSLEEQIAYLKENNLLINIKEGFNHINNLIKNYKEEQNQILPFLVNNKYQIFFDGNSSDDICSLNPDVIMNLINKLSSPLATEDVISTSVGICHVNQHYGTSYLRIHLGRFYRIVFERYHGMTIILGVVEKTGKNEDYNAFDAVAFKSNMIHKRADAFKNGVVTTEHAKTIDFLQEYYQRQLGLGNHKIN